MESRVKWKLITLGVLFFSLISIVLGVEQKPYVDINMMGNEIYNASNINATTFYEGGQSLSSLYNSTFNESYEAQLGHNYTSEIFAVVDNKTFVKNYTRAFTLTICAADSKDKTNCDYVCDGTNDHTEINTAISALPSCGGIVYLMEGSYNLGANIDTVNNMVLMGAGNGTVISGASIKVNNVNYVTVRDLKLTGATVGVDIASNSENIKIMNCIFVGHSIGVMTEGINSNIIIRGNDFYDVTSHAVLFDKTTESTISNNYVNNANSNGDGFIIWRSCENIMVTNNLIMHPQEGIGQISTAKYVTISNNIVFNFSSMIGGLAFAIGTSNSQFINNIVLNGSSHGIHLNLVSGTVVTGNNVQNNEQMGIYILGGSSATDNLISNNLVRNNDVLNTASYDGIHVGGNDNIVIGNRIANNDRCELNLTGYNNTVAMTVVKGTDHEAEIGGCYVRGNKCFNIIGESSYISWNPVDKRHEMIIDDVTEYWFGQTEANFTDNNLFVKNATADYYFGSASFLDDLIGNSTGQCIAATNSTLGLYNINVTYWGNHSTSDEWITPSQILDVDDEDIETDLNTYWDIAGDDVAGNITLQTNDTYWFGNLTHHFAGIVATKLYEAGKSLESIYCKLTGCVITELNVTNDLRVDTDTLFVDSSLDRVGIGTDAPAYELDVIGDVSVKDYLYSNITCLNSPLCSVNNTWNGTCVLEYSPSVIIERC